MELNNGFFCREFIVWVKNFKYVIFINGNFNIEVIYKRKIENFYIRYLILIIFVLGFKKNNLVFFIIICFMLRDF